ncbi:MAG: hypothetical protein P4M08_10610 [Oligoflexia bacterium]|nr:hypothetical protein [Oligoflexia bacterium]
MRTRQSPIILLITKKPAKWLAGLARGAGISLCLALTSCMTTNGSSSQHAYSSTTGSGTSTLTQSSFDNYVINNVTIAVPTGSSSSSTTGSNAVVTVLLNPTSSSTKLLTDCPAASNSCVCQFSWTETNTTSGTTVTIPRQVTTPVSSVPNSTELTCPAPSVYGTEIQNGTQLNITVVGPTGGSTQATFNTYVYSVGANSSSTPSNFTDSKGTPFANISRYTCYEQQKKGLVVQNAHATPSNQSDQGSASLGAVGAIPIASKFCLQSATSASTSTECSTNNLPASDYTAQSYYFNLYIQQNAEGNINPGNGTYVCPLVKEALSESSGNLGTQGKAWPLDTTFALSQTMTSSYTVPIAANVATSDSTDTVSNNVSCAQMADPSNVASPTPSSTSSSGPFVSSCLGFAAAASANGSCGKINGVQTYRLRRYFTIYPPIFDVTGNVPPNTTNAQQIDTIYVIDRPVTNPSDPSAVISMLGPKPCPFSYFDNTGVTGGRGYRATNNSLWAGTNVDGTQFPNIDALPSANNNVASCSALLPLPNWAQTEMSATTINASNPIGTGAYPGDPTRSLKKVYIRPVDAWAPHYVEDTSFQACAPLSSQIQDPPLHFAKLSTDKTTVTWCAEVYPSQNDNVTSLDPNNAGTVAPYTSHVPTGTSVGCTEILPNHGLTTIPSGYPSTGLANHSGTGANTCDRTALNPAGGLAWKKFPLLSPQVDTENMLQNDSGYGCTLSFYNGNAPTKNSPSGGCCGTNVSVIPGATGSATAHLEPPLAPANSNCLVPNY